MKRKYAFVFKILALSLIVGLSSCQSQKGWVYKSNRWTPVEKKQEKILIPTFTDDRVDENKNAIMMYYCPFVPFGWQNLSTPELVPIHLNSGTWMNYDPKVDFAKALVKEIKDGSSFKEVQYTDGSVASEYYIQGRIINTNYKAKMFSYCLSYFGGILWTIGLPAGTFSNELAIELTCYSPDNKILLQKTYKAKPYKKTTWIYHLRSDFAYPTLLKGVYLDFIRDFNRTLKNPSK